MSSHSHLLMPKQTRYAQSSATCEQASLKMANVRRRIQQYPSAAEVEGSKDLSNCDLRACRYFFQGIFQCGKRP